MLKNNIKFLYTGYFKRNKLKNNEIKVNVPKSYKMPYIAFKCKIATPTVIFKKEILKGLKFSNSIKYGEDIIFWSKLSKRVKLSGLNLPTTIVNVSNNSTSQSIANLKKGYVSMNKELLKKNSLVSKLHYLYINIKLSIKFVFEFFF